MLIQQEHDLRESEDDGTCDPEISGSESDGEDVPTSHAVTRKRKPESEIRAFVAST